MNTPSKLPINIEDSSKKTSNSSFPWRMENLHNNSILKDFVQCSAFMN